MDESDKSLTKSNIRTTLLRWQRRLVTFYPCPNMSRLHVSFSRIVRCAYAKKTGSLLRSHTRYVSMIIAFAKKAGQFEFFLESKILAKDSSSVGCTVCNVSSHSCLEMTFFVPLLLFLLKMTCFVLDLGCQIQGRTGLQDQDSGGG